MLGGSGSASRSPCRSSRWRWADISPACINGSVSDIELAAAGAGHAGGAVGRLAVFRARRASLGHPQPQYVHAHRHGHRRRVALQRRRHPLARSVSRRLPQHATDRCRSTSRRRRSSPCSCFSARCSSFARASRPAAPFARSSIFRRRRRAASATTAAMRT